MSDIALQLSYSVEADVSPAFAWQHRTDVTNWRDPPGTFVLDGPFEAGTCGTTSLPGQPPLHWRISEVITGKSFTLEMPLDEATLAFQWSFEEIAAGRTRLTQQIVLSGNNARAYTAQVEAGFGPNLADGMKRIAADLALAECETNRDSANVGSVRKRRMP